MAVKLNARIRALEEALRAISLMGNYGEKPPMVGLMPTVVGKENET